ncbi:MAG: hypothetical protein KGO02_10870 [Alphaproteobacteria bacterium]|nr:hypothetical protein [Alphaproteobacteria bacterium]
MSALVHGIGAIAVAVPVLDLGNSVRLFHEQRNAALEILRQHDRGPLTLLFLCLSGRVVVLTKLFQDVLKVGAHCGLSGQPFREEMHSVWSEVALELLDLFHGQLTTLRQFKNPSRDG